ncbi:Protein of unknown function [Marinactinospora thermotolerans DSM 45154]|uniref:Heparan-alpha-glucosaminide N-acetyltransferase catalytic domain-containing protein n=1 Tax=Marinactinospora thermotolerans DSM 45154 TaxID=1122192 RepID=A0A1T4RML6_9ACTN|nr:Protein of unknown function [Marinactinospora thermotolerans DSM 45154]
MPSRRPSLDAVAQHAPGTGTQEAVRPDSGRIVGVDVARALAVFGMFTVHLGVGASGLLSDPAMETLHDLARGRSSALFAFLAGVSIALLSGRTVPLTGPPLHRAAARILVRAVILALLGGLLDLLDTPIAIILAYYGGFFLLALPLLRLRAPALAAIAVGIGLLGPQVSYLLRSVLGEEGARQGSIGGITDLLLTGYYPVCTFMAFVVAGMAVGRLDLRAVSTRVGLAATGLGLVLLGYGGSWVLLRPLGVLDRLVVAEMTAYGYYGPGDTAFLSDADLGPLRAWMVEQIASLHGTVPTTSPLWLLVASPHSGTSFEVAGATGTALMVLAACLVAADLLGRGLYPLFAAGSMALTLYTGHILVLAVTDADYGPLSGCPLEAFVVGGLLFATLWRALLGRGPLERALAVVGEAAARNVAPEPAVPRSAPRKPGV